MIDFGKLPFESYPFLQNGSIFALKMVSIADPLRWKKNKNDSKKRLFLSGNGWNKRIEVFCKQSACNGHSKHFDKDIILYKLPAEILLVFMLRL